MALLSSSCYWPQCRNFWCRVLLICWPNCILNTVRDMSTACWVSVVVQSFPINIVVLSRHDSWSQKGTCVHLNATSTNRLQWPTLFVSSGITVWVLSENNCACVSRKCSFISFQVRNCQCFHLQTTAGECVCLHLQTFTDNLCKILWQAPNGGTCYRKASIFSHKQRPLW